MRRKVFNFAAALSLVLCLATVAMWVRSYWSSDTVGWQTLHISKSSMDSHFHGLCWSVGRLVVEFDRTQHFSDLRGLLYVPREQEGTHLVAYGFRPGDMPDDYPSGWHGFLIDFSQGSVGSQTGGIAAIGAPFWLLAVAALFLPGGLFLARRRRLSRLDRSACSSCGCNLTGNTSGVCPECGTPVAGEPRSAKS